MMPQFIQGNLLWEALFALGVASVSVIVSQLTVLVFNRLLKTLTRKTRTTLDDLIINALSRPIFYLVLVQGFYVALTSLTVLDRYQVYVNKVWILAIIAVLAYGVQRVVAALLTWYGQEFSRKTKGTLDDRLVPILRRIVSVVIYAVALMIILDDLGVAISPLITGLGLGGLAVALALQPTLTNFIASAYIVSEARIGVGDRIQVEGGPTGIVEDIGWRTTKLRNPQNNLITVPNSKLADSIVTNFQIPEPAVTAVVSCGVSYESDLEHVRQVTLDVVRQLVNESPDSVKEFQPRVLFYEFSDSNINFRTIFQAKDYVSQFPLIDAFISRLHRRFAVEGIEINYPVRKLVYPQQDGARLERPEVEGKLYRGPEAQRKQLPTEDDARPIPLGQEADSAADVFGL
jgi:small-conductance mechanosensitive channel